MIGSFDLTGLAGEAEAWVASPEDVVLVSGSIVEGFGNSTSDYDVYMVYRHTPDRAWAGARLILHGDTMLDYEGYASDHLKTFGDSVTRISPSDIPSVQSLSWNDLDLYYRLSIAIPLVNEVGFTDIRSHFVTSHCNAITTVWAAIRARAELDRARAQLAGRKYEAAGFRARSALEWAADSFLSANGEGYTSRKWRFEKLKRRFGVDSDVYRSVWNLKALGNQQVEPYVSACADFAERVCLSKVTALPTAETGGDNGTPVVGFPQARADVQLFTIGLSHVLIHNRAFIYELDPFAAAVWQAADRHSNYADAVSSLSKEFSLTKTAAETKLKRVVEAFRDAHLVQ